MHDGVRKDRSIPACAGEPPPPGPETTGVWVHPRVCGGADSPPTDTPALRGPSPRVRGSQRLEVLVARALGSIPACAGEPALRHIDHRARWVHPRVCGGAWHLFSIPLGREGPSPRVRGSRLFPQQGDAPVGSIPACAGEPLRASHSSNASGVHPRVCGGAGVSSSDQSIFAGPSPRVRGSRDGDRIDCAVNRSIPACAGEPRRRCRRAPARQGPSPRVRGSPAILPASVASIGSIPACAGEP